MEALDSPRWLYDDPQQRALALGALLQLQDHRCAICGHREGDVGRRPWPTAKLAKRVGAPELFLMPFESIWPTDTSPVRFGVDHDHATGLVRGVLCTGCNRLVGWCEQGNCTCMWGRCHTADYIASPPAAGGTNGLPAGGVWIPAMLIRPGDAILNHHEGVWYANPVTGITTTSVASDRWTTGEFVAVVEPDLIFTSFHGQITPVVRHAESSRTVTGMPMFTADLREAAA